MSSRVHYNFTSRWNRVTLTLDGPAAKEQDTAPSPFTDYDFTVTFSHASGAPSYRVPGYFAADGNAANDNSKYCFAKSGGIYLVYLPNGGTTELDLSGAAESSPCNGATRARAATCKTVR